MAVKEAAIHERVRGWHILVVLLGVVLLGALLGCGHGGDTYGRVPTPDPTHLTVCSLGDPETLDPARASSAPDLKIVFELFDGLTTFDRDGLPVPSLAERWEVGPDQRRFVFHLRQDARWSNGRPLTADDFVYSFARVLHPATGAMNADALRRLKNGARYADGTARVVLADTGPFHAGDAVVAVDADAPSPNLRVPRAPLPLRAAPAVDAEVWATAPAGAPVTIVERSCRGAACWAYVHAPAAGEEGAYGYLPLDGALDAPNDARRYHVRALGDAREGEVAGRDLLMLPDLLGVHAADPHTLVVETEGPTPVLLDLTLQHGFRPVPREAVSRWPRTWTRPGRIVTSGPFLLAEQRTRDRVELVRAPRFWGAAGVRLERVSFLTLETQAASANVYVQGGCDALIANNLPMTDVPAVRGKRDATFAPYLGTYFLLVNTRRLTDAHVRRALAFALDRDALVRLLRGGQRPSEQLVPGTPIAELSPAERALCGVDADAPGVALIVEQDRLCYRPPFGPGFDPEAARREWALAGAAAPAHLSLRYNAGVPMHRTVAEWAQAEWRRVLGVDVAVEAQDWKSYLAATARGEYELARMSWLGNFADPESEFVAAFRCGAPDNRPGLCDPEVDRLLATAAIAGDRAARLALVRAAEARVVDTAAVIPLFDYTQVVLQKPYVRDLYINLTDHQSLRATWIEAPR
jgi:oligopeptide transport system substrate-binding protein